MGVPVLQSNNPMRQRLKHLLLVTLGGVLIGISGDFFRSPAPVGFGDILAGILLSPLVVTFGGRQISIPGLELGGLLFWPVYLALAILWLRTGRLPFLLFVLPWAAQGFFQVGFRWFVMSGV